MGEILFKGRNRRRLLARSSFIRACLEGRRYAFTDHRGSVIYSLGSPTSGETLRRSADEWRRAYREAAMERLDAACMLQRQGIRGKAAGLDRIRVLEAVHGALGIDPVNTLSRAPRLAKDPVEKSARAMLARLRRKGVDPEAERRRRAGKFEV